MKGSTVFERSRPADALVSMALRGTANAPFWLEDVADAPAYPQLRRDTRADLAIVGAGYCGLWTAVLAKQANPASRVVVLEAETVGWAASGRNGGFCEASLTHGHDNGRTRWPDEIDTLDALGDKNLDEIERAIGDLGLDCQFERTGDLSVAIEAYQADDLWATSLGPGEVFLDEAAVQAEVRSPTYLAGIWAKNSCALVHPARLASELARVATDLGVEVFEHSAVAPLGSSRDRPVTLQTSRGRVLADRVVLATNVFAPLLTRLRYFTVPVYDYALMTEPLTAEQRAAIGWSNRQGIGDSANQFHYYRQSADHRILFGGYDAVYHFGRKVRAGYEERPASYRRLASHFLTTFPQLEGIRFTHQWAGAVDTSTRFCAFYGLAKQGRVAYASGFTGLGVGATHFAAKVMLDLLSGATTERTELAMVRTKPLPFPPEPFAALGINATRWSLDRADHQDGRRNLFLRTLDKVGLGFDS